MAKIGEFIHSIATRAGVAVDNEKLKSLLSEPTLSNIDIDQSIVETINRGLLTEDAALNTPSILAKARAEAYNRVDETVSKSILDLLDDSDRELVKGKKLTVERIDEIGKYIARLKEAKKDAGSKVDKDAFQKQIDELQLALKNEKAAAEASIQKLKADFENEAIESNLKLMLTGRPYKLATDSPEDKQFAIDAALLRVKQQMAAKGLKLTRENGELKLLTNENLKPYDAGNEIQLHNFIEGAVAPLIAPVPPAGGGNPPPAPGGGPGSGQPVKGLESAMAKFAEFNEGFKG